MKIFLKITLAVLVILLIIFAFNTYQKYKIIKNIYELGNSFSLCNNYHLEEKIHTSHQSSCIDIYFKDNEYLYIEDNALDDNSYDEIIYHNLDTNEYKLLTSNKEGKLELEKNPTIIDKTDLINKYIFCNAYKFSDLMQRNILRRIKTTKTSYILKDGNQYEYISKKTGLLTRVSSSKNNIEIQLTYEPNVVTDRLIDLNLYYKEK